MAIGRQSPYRESSFCSNLSIRNLQPGFQGTAPLCVTSLIPVDVHDYTDRPCFISHRKHRSASRKCLAAARVVTNTFDTPVAQSLGIPFLTSTIGFEAIYSISASATLMDTSLTLLAIDRVLMYLDRGRIRDLGLIVAPSWVASCHTSLTSQYSYRWQS